MSAKRKELKHDKFVEGTITGVRNLSRYWRGISTGALVLVVLVLLVVLLRRNARMRDDQGWTLYGAALRGQGKDLAADLKNILDTRPGLKAEPYILFQLGRTLAAQGDYADARTILDRLIASAPGHYTAPAARLVLARILEAEGKAPEALAAYRDLKGRHPESSERLIADQRLAGLERDKGGEKVKGEGPKGP